MRACLACDGRGGFNRFLEAPIAGSTATETVHQWIPCSLCTNRGTPYEKYQTNTATKFDGVTPEMEEQ